MGNGNDHRVELLASDSPSADVIGYTTANDVDTASELEDNEHSTTASVNTFGELSLHGDSFIAPRLLMSEDNGFSADAAMGGNNGCTGHSTQCDITETEGVTTDDAASDVTSEDEGITTASASTTDIDAESLNETDGNNTDIEVVIHDCDPTPLPDASFLIHKEEEVPFFKGVMINNDLSVSFKSPSLRAEVKTSALKKRQQSILEIIRLNKTMFSQATRCSKGCAPDYSATFGDKFIAICICCAFGGRRGLDKYDGSFELSKYKITSILNRMRGCLHSEGTIIIVNLCCLGHIILLCWSLPNGSEAIKSTFGPLVSKTIQGKKRVKREIGSVHLWASMTNTEPSKKKTSIIADYKKKFPLDGEFFAAVWRELDIIV